MRILTALLLTVLATSGALAEPARPVSLPPASLAQWYKPANERQVWLHTMFSLRRSLQAVSEYAALGDAALTRKWAERFASDYRRIPQMVPEWQGEVELEQADRLVAAAGSGDMNGVNSALHRLGTTCRSCHNEFRAIATLTYRTPDYHTVKVENSETLEEIPYPDVMERLSLLLNRVKIAHEDGRREAAREAATALTAGMRDLEKSCAACHADAAPRARIFSAEVQRALTGLPAAAAGTDGKAVGQALGVIGADACGRCHGVHRTAAELRHTLLPHRD